MPQLSLLLNRYLMSKPTLFFSITLLVVGVVVVLMLLVKGASGLDGGNTVTLKTPLSSSDWTRGSASSTKAVLIEYADFQCPACASYHPLVKELEKDFSNDLVVAYRHFPLPQHRNAVMASVAAEAAGKEGRFWEMHDLLFEKQAEWSDVSDPTEIFLGYANTLGLNTESFAEALADASLKAKVEQHKLDGVKNGVNSTPTFFLNGVRLINPLSYPAFKEVVEKAIADSAQAAQ